MIYNKILNTIDDAPNAWDTLTAHDIFLSSAFLKGLELSPPKNIRSYYLCIYKHEELVGVAVIQRVQMYFDDIFRNSSNHFLKQMAKRLIARIIRGNALIVGNLMHTGQHGVYLQKEKISQDEFLCQISIAVETLTKNIREKFGKRIRIIAFKDYFENDSIHNSQDFFKSKNLYKVQVQPNMILNIDGIWRTPEDYISAFSKKYRARYKSARKKSAQIERRELNLQDIEWNSDVLFKLYENVSDNARVNSFKLSPNHFYHLKQRLNGDFKVFAYVLNNKIIGFYTLILNNDELETYFLGYNQVLQHKHQMYLNMLFDMAIFAIEHEFKRVIYARTAMEIKSSVGAKPHMMQVYLKHTNNFIANTILKFIVKYMNPIRQWQERHPFKN